MSPTLVRARNVLGRVRTLKIFTKEVGRDVAVTLNFVPWWLQDVAQGAFAAAGAILSLKSLDWACVSEDVA